MFRAAQKWFAAKINYNWGDQMIVGKGWKGSACVRAQLFEIIA
jgi:hypothetical protein